LKWTGSVPPVEAEFVVIDEPTRAAVAFAHMADHSSALAMYGRSESRLRRAKERAEAQINLLQTRR
jgi:hypothetical protein